MKQNMTCRFLFEEFSCHCQAAILLRSGGWHCISFMDVLMEFFYSDSFKLGAKALPWLS